MRILVTGGAGFIGSHVVDALIKQEHSVAIVDNLSTGKKENINHKATFYEIDICSKELEKVFQEMYKAKKNWLNNNSCRFVCSLTLHWPNGKNYSANGMIKGKISGEKRGNKGFGYDPIFIPDGYTKTFGELDPRIKMSIDHRFNAFKKIKNFFN